MTEERKSVPLRTIADRLVLSRSAAWRHVQAQGYQFHYRIDPKARNQRVACLYEDELEELIEFRQQMML